MKNRLGGFNDRSDISEEKVNQLQRKNKQSINELWANFKGCNTHAIGGEKGGDCAEKT